MPAITAEQIKIFLSLFRGRQDVYARYWAKEARSGYSPAYEFNWSEFLAFKNQGGTLKDFQNKKLAPLTSEVVKRHLLGQQTIGIYPILPDNTSYFVAADFDEKDWLQDSKSYISECQEFGLSAYLERSRSGNGGHVWIFLGTNYPCHKSRRLALELIRRAFKMSEFDKEVAFDRLFPNQDSLPPNGFGNLIALPFQGNSVSQGNTLFIDIKTDVPYPDQWEFFKNIKKHTASELDAVYDKLFGRAENRAESPSNNVTSPDLQKEALHITLNNKVGLKRSQLTSQIIDFIKEQLNFINTEYLVKKHLGKSVYRVQKYFRLIEEYGDEVYIPRGFLSQFKKFLEENGITYDIADGRPQLGIEKFSFHTNLFPEQSYVVEKAIQKDSGVIVAPSGSGKTIMGLAIVAQRSLPALILVHRKQLLDQWVERIQSFLGISQAHIGQYSGVKKKQGKQISVAMLQSLARLKDLSDLKNSFGTIIAVNHGITEIIIHETMLSIPFKFSTDNFQLLSKIICYDTTRNQLIVKDIEEQVTKGKKVLLLSERRDHLEILNLYLKGVCETIVISGEDSAAKRQIKLSQIGGGHFQVILSTGQFFGEGLDIATIDCLILAFPFSFEGKLIQYIGRLRGHNNHKVIIDYRDSQIPFLERQFKQRQRYYKKIQRMNAG